MLNRDGFKKYSDNKPYSSLGNLVPAEFGDNCKHSALATLLRRSIYRNLRCEKEK